MPADLLRILFAEPQEIVQAGYRHIIDTLNADARFASDHDQALSSFAELRPQMVVLDEALAPRGGLHTAEEILSRDKDARILYTANKLSAAEIDQGTNLGIVGFVYKGSTLADLVDALRQVSRGERYVHPQFTRSNGRDSTSALQLLSPREFEVFKLLAAGHSPGSVANQLNISLKTACNHSTRIKKKLQVQSVAGLTLMAVRSHLLEV